MSTEADPPVTPGVKTSEFWLHVLALTVAALLASDLIPAGSDALKIAGILASVLTSLGYSAVRTSVKNTARRRRSSAMADGSAGAIAVQHLIESHQGFLIKQHMRLEELEALKTAQDAQLGGAA